MSFAAAPWEPSADALEDLLEAEDRSEAGGLDEARAGESDRELEVVDRARRIRDQPPAEEPRKQGAHHELGQRQRLPGALADRGVERDLAGSDDVEDTLEAVLERERDR